MTTRLYQVKVFRDDETTAVVYDNVTHVFWEAKGTVLVICLPGEGKHVHWLREQICRYETSDMPTT